MVNAIQQRYTDITVDIEYRNGIVVLTVDHVAEHFESQGLTEVRDTVLTSVRKVRKHQMNRHLRTQTTNRVSYRQQFHHVTIVDVGSQSHRLPRSNSRIKSWVKFATG
ncbi:hypothetical protein D3C80_1167940 [compost metagenome]